MKRIDWLKLDTGFFDDEKIILLLSMRNGEKLILFFLRLLTISAKQNQNGKISFSDNVPYSVKNLANICQISARKCEDFLKILEQFEIIYTDFSQNSGKQLEKSSKNKYIFISNWEKHQSVDELEKIRQQQKERNKKWRDKQKECDVTDTSPIRHGDAIEVELDKEKEQKENFSSKIIIDSLDGEVVDSNKSPTPKDTCTFLHKVKSILKHLNDSTGSHFRCTESFKKTVIARLKDGYTVDDFVTVIEKKTLEWKCTEFEKYLCPTTLFRASKFDEYLNQKSKCKINQAPGGISNFKGRS